MAQPNMMADLMKTQVLMRLTSDEKSPIKNFMIFQAFEMLMKYIPTMLPKAYAMCCTRRSRTMSSMIHHEIRKVSATIFCERTFQATNTGKNAAIGNHSRMDSVIHHITTLPAIRNLLSITHHDYLPNDFEPIELESDIFFELSELKHEDGQVSTIKFRLYCYDHPIQHLQQFVDKCNSEYERRMANKLGTSLYYFDMITQSKSKKSIQNPLPTTHLLYTRHKFHTNRTFDNVFFEQKEVIRNHVNFFLTRKDWYDKKGIPYTLGFMFHGEPGCGKCLGYNTPVMMYDGTIKFVQDIQIGDKLMGDDSSPRNVLSLARGREKMYRVVPVKGDSYVVNESHILSLMSSNTKYIGNIVDIGLKNYLELPKSTRGKLKGYRVPVVFPHKNVNIDPYLLGYWLGDGSSTKPQITTADIDVVSYLTQILDKIDIDLLKGSDPYGWNMRSRGYNQRNSGKENKGCNKFLTFLQNSNLIGNKHIPDVYKYNSREIQLAVLAGIIDSDGYLHGNCYDITLVNEKLLDDVIYISRSLGFSAYKSICTKTCTNGSYGPTIGTYFRTIIHGKGLHEIPVVLDRKKTTHRKQVKNSLVTGIKIEPLDIDDYYGFEIDGNKRFLLGDFTVTHNTSTIKAISNISRRHIINIQLSQIKSKEQLRHLFFNDEIHVYDGLKTEKFLIPVHERLFVIEDIDAMGDTVLRREFKKPEVEKPVKKCAEDAWMDRHKEEDEAEPLDLSFLLNLLDGTLEADGRMLAISSNHPERIDRALIRPGRIDMIVHFKKCNSDILKQMVNSFYDQQFEDWTTSELDYKWSPAEVNQILFRNFKTPDVAINELKTLTPHELYGIQE